MHRLAIAFLLVSCTKSESKPQASKTHDVPAAAPGPKQPVPTKPLPTLTQDKGGATGKPVWAAGFGGLGVDSPRGLALGSDGSVYVAGYFDGEIDFGALGKHKSAGGSDAYIAKLGSDGKLVWAKTWGAKRDDVANAV